MPGTPLAGGLCSLINTGEHLLDFKILAYSGVTLLQAILHLSNPKIGKVDILKCRSHEERKRAVGKSLRIIHLVSMQQLYIYLMDYP